MEHELSLVVVLVVRVAAALSGRVCLSAVYASRQLADNVPVWGWDFIPFFNGNQLFWY